MAVQLSKRLLTVEEYNKMAEVGILQEKGIELINGEIIEMSPISKAHAGCLKRIIAVFREILPKEIILSIQDPLQINDSSEPEPDVMLLRPRNDFYSSRHPIPSDVNLLIEVAESSLEYDREIKLPLYAAAGIPEYWIANLKNKRLEVYRQPEGEGYGEKVILKSDDEVGLKSLDLKISVKDLLG